MTRKRWALLAVGVLCFVLLAGCTSMQEEDVETTERYHVVLHPVGLEWTQATQTLSGNVTLSNIPPPTYERELEASEARVSVAIKYFSTPPPADLADEVADWQLDYDVFEEVVIANGETWVFNFSVTPENGTPEVRGILLDIDYHYRTTLSGDEAAWRVVGITYHNPCIQVEGDQLRQVKSGSQACTPFRYRETFDSRYYLWIGSVRVPPVEDWNNWTQMWSTIEPAHRFLGNFSYAEANLTYFDGEISCSGCLTGGQ